MARAYDEYFFPLFRTLKFMDLLKLDESMPDDAVTVDYLLNNRWVVGDPDHCVEQIKEIYELAGGFGNLLLLSQDWDPGGTRPERSGTVRQPHSPTAKELVPPAP